jgi:hypothetical protein
MTELTTTIGAYDTQNRTVPVTFTSGAIRHTHEVNAVLDEGGAYDKIALGVIAEPAPDQAGPAAA